MEPIKDELEFGKFNKEIGLDFKVFRDVFLIDKDISKYQKIDSLKMILGNIYDDIIEVLKDYCDLKEKDYKIIALWIIGTYFYKEFNSYPILYINAIKGAGKSRTLNLIVGGLSWNGEVIGSPTEAVLFRNAGKGTIGIDEFENLQKKEELKYFLNSCYKKGLKIKRMRKKKTIDGEMQIVEDFEAYTPIALCNIWGMEDVLGDRCITCVIDKSNNPKYTKKIENFKENSKIEDIVNRINNLKKILDSEGLVLLCSYFSVKSIYISWNDWINNKYNIYITNNTNNINNTNNNTTEDLIEKTKIEEFFLKIDKTEISGRDLELFFPLFIIANILHTTILDEILEITKKITKEKIKQEMMENKDILLIEFSSFQDSEIWHPIKEFTNQFKLFCEYDPLDERINWLNPKWMGRALKRLDLILDSRRLSKGKEITINTQKAKEKIKIFK